MPLSPERATQQHDVLLALKAISTSLCRDATGSLNAIEVTDKFTEVMKGPPISFTEEDIHFWLSYYGINFPQSGVYRRYDGSYHVVLGIAESDPQLDYMVIHGLLSKEPKVIATRLIDFTAMANYDEPMYSLVTSRQNQPYMVHAKQYEPILRNIQSTLMWSDAALSKGFN